MEETRNLVLEIANRLYDLDAEVYRVLGSGLGRVFNASREESIRELTQIMKEHRTSHYLRSSLALIGNMARTIPERQERSRVMTEYNEIWKLIQKLPDRFGAVDILDETLAGLNQSFSQNSWKGRFNAGNHLVICIGRTYGSAGTDVGFNLADTLKINYYDTEIFAEVLKRLEAQQDHIRDRASFTNPQDLNQDPMAVERPKGLKARIREFSRYHGLPKAEAVFFNQSELICDMARREDFVIMGRCADVILTNHQIPHVSIFVNAPFEVRVRRVMKQDNLDYKSARKFLKKVDRRHRSYSEFFTSRKWGDVVNYDLCINSASYGIEGSVQLIERLLLQK